MAISKIITSSLTDDAVTSAKIGTDQVGADALSSSAISGAVDIPANSVGQSELSIDLSAQSVPHIIPGVLQPAIAGKLLNGANHSGAYGTPQTQSGGDGHSYYYTDIKGSKPIKDPRIGGHFGSQRYMFSSEQLLEHETAMNGANVHSIDGREFIRRVGNIWTTVHGSNGYWHYTSNSNAEDTHFYEITGYFNAANWLTYPDNLNDVNISIDGTANSSTFSSGTPSITTPLTGRFVNAQSVVALTFDSTPTLGIHTLKLSNENGDYMRTYGIELITQDTTSTANRSKIQIPAQNVVSGGKKFAISATADHYDPFSAKTDGSAWTSPTSGTNNANSAASWPTNIDTANSLGLDKWVDGSNYYRPYNGGRVVKYVDSTGTIKTAVTVMPPNAKSIKSADINKKAKNDPNDTYLPTFEDETTDVNEDNLHEVAKTFHYREFGNGAANAGTLGANYADASMLNTEDDIGYVMDDGLTSLAGDNVYVQGSPPSATGTNDKGFYFTFIGTGLNIQTTSADGTGVHQYVQNLPYGTHIVKHYRGGSGGTNTADSVVTIDGVSLGAITIGNYSAFEYVSFFQPKRPPIPEDACVIADYMLMADFVPQGAVGVDKLSKGTRILSTSRDIFFSGGSVNIVMHPDYPEGFYSYSNTNGYLQKLPFFGSGVVKRYEGNTSNGATLGFTNDGTNFSGGTFFGGASSNQLNQSNGAGNGHFGGIHSLDVGVYTSKLALSGTNYFRGNGYEVVTPIHTSFHYQSFETPFTHDLIGGDRNMEQTNLVCTPDGKTWDEVTRDTSYLGTDGFYINEPQDTGGAAQDLIFTEYRGPNFGSTCFNKNFAIGYNSMVCLKAGFYFLKFQTIENTNAQGSFIKKNGSTLIGSHSAAVDWSSPHNSTTVYLKRGDRINVNGPSSENMNYVNFLAYKIE